MPVSFFNSTCGSTDLCVFFSLPTLSVQVTFESGVSVSGGDLSEAYDSVQFHLHWGNGTAIPGSEHTVDGKRYPMEVHKHKVCLMMDLWINWFSLVCFQK